MNPRDLDVYVVDDDDSVCRSVGALLVSRGYGVKAFASGENFLASTRLHQGGCVLLDRRMAPGMSGLQVFDELRRRGSPLVVVFLSGHGDIPTTVAAVKDGAFDWLEKPCDEARLLEVVKAALDKAALVASEQGEKVLAREQWKELTGREAEVAGQVRFGRQNKVIGKNLGIDGRTVEAHRARVYDKLGVSNATEVDRLMRDIDL